MLLACLMAVGCRKLPPAGTADQPPQPTSPADLYTDLNPRWSHDGRQVAFLRATPDHRMQLHLADAGLERPLALLESELLCPDRPYRPSRETYASPDTLAWSPDDRRIAFERIEWFTFEDGERLPGTGLWSFDTRSGRVTPLAVHPPHYLSVYYYYHTPEWSPDGRYLAFVAEGISGQRGLCIRPVAGQKPQETRPRFDNYEDSDWLSWEPVQRSSARPARSALVYRQSLQRSYNVPPTETLRRVTPGSADGKATGEFWRITNRDYKAASSALNARSASAPNARSDSAGAAGEQSISLRIGQPVWSPDGARLAFTLTPDANDYTRYEIWVWKRSDGKAQRVNTTNRGCFAPVWLGSETLGCLSKQGERYAVCVVAASGGSVRPLGTIGSADCDWSPDRSKLVWASPQPRSAAEAEAPTTLHLFSTGLRVPKS
jgi:dipeptidyl aminopeptidase/acylaminoacyl peptidase